MTEIVPNPSTKEVGPLGGDHCYAIAAAYTNACHVEDQPPSIPASAISGNVPVAFDPNGFQPMGISPHPFLADHYLVADYDGPGIVIVKAGITPEGRFELQVIRWVRWTVLPESQQQYPGNSSKAVSIRLFPLDPRTDTKRCQTAVWSRDGQRIIYARNGENGGPIKVRDQHGRILSTHPGGLWVARTYKPNPPWLQLEEKPIELEGQNLGNIEGMVVGEDDILYLLRSHQNGDPAWLTTHAEDGKLVDHPELHNPPPLPWLYGPGIYNGKVFYITDRRLPKREAHGIYRGNQLVVPGVTGNGIAFRSDGSALVTQYNAGVGPLGSPGRILFIPAVCFSH